MDMKETGRNIRYNFPVNNASVLKTDEKRKIRRAIFDGSASSRVSILKCLIKRDEEF
jgi:hypothetical protein